MLSLAYDYKAIPTPEQVQIIEHTLTVCRKVGNFALRERKDWINYRKCQINACSITSEYIIPADTPRPTYAQQCKSLTSIAKRGEKEVTGSLSWNPFKQEPISNKSEDVTELPLSATSVKADTLEPKGKG